MLRPNATLAAEHERIAALDTVQTDSDPATLLSEDPEFYLWLAENGRTELE